MRLTALAEALPYEVAAQPVVPPGDRPTLLDRRAGPQPTPTLLELYYAERSRLLRFFGRRVGRDEAQDLVQETYASYAATLSRQPRSIEHPEAYLSTIAANIVARGARTAARRSTEHHIPIEDAALAGPDPLAGLEARDLLARLETAMRRLRPLTREIFLAHRLDGYSYREIAARTGLSVKRVEKHMSRAIAQLDDVLGTGR